MGPGLSGRQMTSPFAQVRDDSLTALQKLSLARSWRLCSVLKPHYSSLTLLKEPRDGSHLPIIYMSILQQDVY